MKDLKFRTSASDMSRHLKTHSQDHLYHYSNCTITYSKYLNNMIVHKEACLIEKEQPGEVPSGESVSPSATGQKYSELSGSTQQQPYAGGKIHESSRANQKSRNLTIFISEPQSSSSINTTQPSQTKTHKQSKVCRICKKRLPKSSSKKVHMRSRSDLRPHTRPHFEKNFMFIITLRAQELTHNTLFCALCSQTPKS
ncbi:unnamed protein product [Coregonus sp. 'balchen']|nr:unnamed protein product [Coregonus sp. 'balchen']